MKKKYQAFRYVKGSNQYVYRVKRGDKPRLRAFFALLTFFALFSYLGSLELTRVCSVLTKMTQDAFSSVAYAPTKIISPIAYADTKTAGPSATVKPTHEQYILSKSHGDIILRIWNNESSEGKNTFHYCSKQGLTNEFGFGVLNNPPVCFKTFESSVDTVNAWFDRELKTHTLSQSLLLYSGNSQEYIANFLNK